MGQVALTRQVMQAAGGMLLAAAFLTAGALPLAAQGTGASVAMTEPAEDRYAFTPDAVTIPAGAAVTWTNRTDAPRTVTSDTGAFESGRLAENQTFRFTFTTPGTYAYHCSIHPYMHGTVTVTAAGAVAPGAAVAPAGARLPRTGAGSTGGRTIAAAAGLVATGAAALAAALRARRRPRW